MKLTHLTIYIFYLLIFSQADASDKPRNIDWNNLVPNMPELVNPFETLSNEQILDFETLVSIREIQASKGRLDPNKAFEEGIELRYKLERQGLNIDWLMSEYERLGREMAKRNRMTNGELDDQFVRISGYALPLQHQVSGVKELVLVPYVGTHTQVPPPPANQTVYVRLNETHTFTDIYEPVWITGHLSAKATRKMLSLVDGGVSLETGYTLEAGKIEPYMGY